MERGRRSESERDKESYVHNNSDSGNNTVQTLLGVFHETIEMKGKKSEVNKLLQTHWNALSVVYSWSNFAGKWLSL